MTATIPTYDEIGTAIEGLLKDSLITNHNTNFLIFPDGDFEKTGRPYNRSTVIFTIPNQVWTPPTNPAVLSAGGDSPQQTNIDLFFFIRSVSKRASFGIFPIKDTIISTLRGVQLSPLLGRIYPVSFSYQELDPNCQWSYQLIFGLSHLDEQPGKKHYELDQNNGQPTAAF